jgi:hypothetical protein
MQTKLLGIIVVDFDVIDQIFGIHQILESKWEYNEWHTVHSSLRVSNQCLYP